MPSPWLAASSSHTSSPEGTARRWKGLVAVAGAPDLLPPMQKADGVINHILKNAMVEALGHVETFLDLCLPPPPPPLVRDYLNCAIERLRCGMTWCKRRKVVYTLMNSQVTPALVPVNLADLGTSLAACTGHQLQLAALAPVALSAGCGATKRPKRSRIDTSHYDGFAPKRV